jgi:hypothetical protein
MEWGKADRREVAIEQVDEKEFVYSFPDSGLGI